MLARESRGTFVNKIAEERRRTSTPFEVCPQCWWPEHPDTDCPEIIAPSAPKDRSAVAPSGTQLGNAGVSVCAVADAFPMMPRDDWRPFVDNIRANGLLNPIVWASDGSLLDGRNRLTAWLELGNTVESCPSVTVPEGTDELAFVAAQNVARRNLSSGQRACVAVLNEGPYKARAKEREASSQYGSDNFVTPGAAVAATDREKRQEQILLTSFRGKADAEMARDYNTSEGYIRRCRKLYRDNHALFLKVLNGSKTVQEAATTEPTEAKPEPGKWDATLKTLEGVGSADVAALMGVLATRIGMRMTLNPIQ